MTKKTLDWHVETRKTAELKPYAKNPRVITDDDIAELKDQILESGFHAALTIDADGVVLSGNQRLRALTELGIENVTCIVPDRKLTPKEQERVNLRSNLHKGRWDLEVLAQEFDIDEVLRAGFEDADISAIFDDGLETVDDHFDGARAMREIEMPKTNLNDVIQLGRHTLTCAMPEVDNLAQAVFADVPFSKKYLEESEWMISSGMMRIATKDAHLFAWTDEKYVGAYQRLLTEAGATFKRLCLWVNGARQIVPREAFTKVYEPCVYATKGTPWLNKNERLAPEIMNKEVDTGNQLTDDVHDLLNIWFARTDKDRDGKPVTLYERPLRRTTKAGDVIASLYADDGALLMACEQMNRTCLAFEPDPKACDVIVKRWEEYTGSTAKRL